MYGERGHRPQARRQTRRSIRASRSFADETSALPVIVDQFRDV
jgi:hypothetical protein